MDDSCGNKLERNKQVVFCLDGIPKMSIQVVGSGKYQINKKKKNYFFIFTYIIKNREKIKIN